jgi:hypothetical protein
MGTFTVDKRLLDHDDPSCFSDVLMVLTNKGNKCNLALDRTGMAEELYWKLAETNEMVRTWLNLINNEPPSYYYVDLPTDKVINESELFLEICSRSPVDKKLLTDSVISYNNIKKDQIYSYCGVEINIYGIKEAKREVAYCCSSNGRKKERKCKILMLTATPAGTATLNLTKEHSEIVTKLQNKSKLKVIKKDLINRNSFKEFIEKVKPGILHFSGHSDSEGLYVHNENGNGFELIPTKALNALFNYLKDQGIRIQAVILNSCFSAVQAKVISKHVEFVIGIKTTISDKIAIEFSSGYYFKLVTENFNFEDAFWSGVVQAQLSGASQQDFVLYKNGIIVKRTIK